MGTQRPSESQLVSGIQRMHRKEVWLVNKERNKEKKKNQYGLILIDWDRKLRLACLCGVLLVFFCGILPSRYRAGPHRSVFKSKEQAERDLVSFKAYTGGKLDSPTIYHEKEFSFLWLFGRKRVAEDAREEKITEILLLGLPNIP